MIRLALIGASGRMGKEISEILSVNKGLNYLAVYAVARKKTESNVFQKTVDKIELINPADVDVVVDFSLPEAFDEVLKFCVANKVPLVSGTTGISQTQIENAKKAGEKIPLLWSSNMSLGVLALKKAMESLALLNGFDFQIEEFHHKHKIDRPSGTAISLQKTLEKIIKSDSRKKIPEPVSIRGGGIYGIHKVWSMSDEEVLCFEHQALNRKVFARGALWAASSLYQKKAGFYSMEDLIKWP